MEENDYTMKKVIVTGANGFIGTSLVKKLCSEKIKVYAIIKDQNEDISEIASLENITIVYCDLAQIEKLPQIISDRNFDVFYHLAWIGSAGILRSNYEIQLDNVKYSCSAAKAAKDLNCRRFLCSGTITERIVDTICDNSLMYSQNLIYGICKKTTRTLLTVYCRSIDLDFVWMQFSNIYGPYNKSGNLISYTLNEIFCGRIPEFSSGEQPYDFIYIDDVIRAVYLLGEKDLNKDFYFIGSGSSRNLKDYLLNVPKIIGNNVQIAIGKRPEDGLKYRSEWFDINDLTADTGFNVEYTFEEGIKKTVEWEKHNRQY